jgi:hypothetical protein
VRQQAAFKIYWSLWAGTGTSCPGLTSLSCPGALSLPLLSLSLSLALARARAPSFSLSQADSHSLSPSLLSPRSVEAYTVCKREKSLICPFRAPGLVNIPMRSTHKHAAPGDQHSHIRWIRTTWYRACTGQRGSTLVQSP